MEFIPFPSLAKYLLHCGWLGDAQFGLYVAIFGLLADRGWRKASGDHGGFPQGELVVSKVVEQLTGACMSMGLLLTFAGLYQYIGGANDQQDRWPLLLALGSSALGYTPMMFLQIAGMIDVWKEQAPEGVHRAVSLDPPVGSVDELISRQSLVSPKSTRSRLHESQCDDDVDGRSGHLGGPVPGAVVAAATGVGGVDHHAVEDEFRSRHAGRRPPVNLAHQPWDGDLA